MDERIKKKLADEARSLGYEMVTYGTAKTYDSHAEMVADIQGRPSPVFPLTPEQQVRHEARQAAKVHSITGGFGMARLKKEGAAVHPDDIDAEMTPEQRAKQLAAYERDTGDVLIQAPKSKKDGAE